MPDRKKQVELALRGLKMQLIRELAAHGPERALIETNSCWIRDLSFAQPKNC
jgi:hypothetical protein